MTISYTGDVANASSFGCFNKIIFKWSGSVYKLIYKELLAYISLYYIINIFYREVLVPNSECENCTKWKQSREMFEALRSYCHEQLTSIPLTFVLGFYVSLIVDRWWRQYTLLPWPDSMAIYIVGFLTGKEERQRLMRRNIIRYMLLSYCMAMRTVSFRVKKRFPDLQHLVDAGLMRDDELKVIHELDLKCNANKWFLPLTWATGIIGRALAEGNIRPQTVKSVVGELIHYRNQLTGIINHDWVSVPLVYTQVVTLAVYSYFAAALIGAQWINPETSESYKIAFELPMGKNGTRLDLYYPVFLTVQFVFFFGWLKVAEILINPFGEDDDDFELNRLIDRHTQVGYLIVELDNPPELLKDRYWDECIPKEIPYTIAAEKFKAEEFQGSAEQTLSIKDSDKEYGYVYGMGRYGNANSNSAAPSRNSKVAEDPVYGEYGDYGDYESVGTPIIGHKLSWLKKKMGRLDSIRSNKSISSNSTYIGQYLNKKPYHKSSQLSLYDKITRKISGAEIKEKESKSRRSSRNSKKEKLKTQKSMESIGGNTNESFENEPEEENEDDLNDDDRDFIINKKFLETITENQNSPYSTQASHNTSRRMSAQSIFTDPDRRGMVRGDSSLARDSAPILELFHENEEEDRPNSAFSRKSYSLSSLRSKESGVHSSGATERTSRSSKQSEDVSSALINALLETGEVLPVHQDQLLKQMADVDDGEFTSSQLIQHLAQQNLAYPSPAMQRVVDRQLDSSRSPSMQRVVDCQIDSSRSPSLHRVEQDSTCSSTSTPQLGNQQDSTCSSTSTPQLGNKSSTSTPQLGNKSSASTPQLGNEKQESPSPSLPKRKPVMSYNGIGDTNQQSDQTKYPVPQLKDSEKEKETNVGSLFDQDMGTVYV